MWPGYFAFGGNEFINVERTATYAKNDGASWFVDAYKSKTLALVLGDKPYRAPLQDPDVPWVDPDVPESYDFYGFYPLDISGVDDSTRTSTVVENTGDGGNAGRLRHGTRQMVFSGLLMGATDAAVDAGLTWLKSALLADDGCGGTELCFFSAEPPYDPEVGQECGDDYLRTIMQVTVNSGPTVSARNVMTDGSVVLTIQFTAVANLPWLFGVEEPIVRGFLHAAPFAVGDYDDSGYTAREVKCLQPTYTPVFDPACPALVLPPITPPIQVGCFKPPTNWSRNTFKIPAEYIREWVDSVPVIQVHVGGTQVRDMRIRFYPDPDGTFDPDADPCAFSGDLWLTYIPTNCTFQIDGRDESILVIDNTGQRRRADSLVYDSNHLPFQFPQLSCGVGYVVTVDLPQTQARPKLDLLIAPKVR